MCTLIRSFLFAIPLVAAPFASSHALENSAARRMADLNGHQAYLEERLQAVPRGLSDLQAELEKTRRNHGITPLGLIDAHRSRPGFSHQ